MTVPLITDAEIDALLGHLNARADADGILVLDAARRAAIRGHQHVHACPGAGKTTLVGLKLILLVRKWNLRRRGICVLTHTNIAKEEILRRVRSEAAGRSLLGYPHFVGTIQDFVQTFLAFPACRSKNYPIRCIDDETATAFIKRHLSHGTQAYLQHQNQSVSGLRLKSVQGTISINVPGNPGPHTASYQNMVSAKNKALNNGYFFYSEMYALGDELIASNPPVVSALRHRFPVVLVDEMQDTQRFQDELINRIFDQTAECSLQKVGDPDQAIFDGMAGDAPNQTFNGAVLLAPIPDSGRFTSSIANKIRGLSTRRVALTGSLAPIANAPECTFILYDDATIGAVLERFGAITGSLPESEREVVKVVGARAEDGTLSIKSYWPAFDRGQGLKAVAPDTFCESLRRCANLRDGHVSMYYLQLRQSLVELLRMSGRTALGRSGNQVPVTLANLARYFQQRGKAAEIKALLADLVMRSTLSPADWAAIVPRLADVCEVDIVAPPIATYLAYSEQAAEFQDPSVLPGNVWVGPNGVHMEVSTIHGVKGETHDATLVLETKYRTYYDIAEMLPFMINPAVACPVFDHAHPNTAASIRATFMRKIYVASSRARRLVCMAMHRARMSAEHEAALREQFEWAIVDLTQPDAAAQ